MLEYLYLLIGLALLYKGAHWLIDGSSSLAKKFGISSLVIGLTVVAFGTSLPELIVNIFAALDSNAAISYGNIIGSNLFNLLFILGITAIVIPLTVQKSTIWKEIPFSLIGAIVLFIMSNEILFTHEKTNILSRSDGIILLLFFAMFLYYIYNMIKINNNSKQENTTIKESNWKLSILIIGGLVCLFFGGKLTVSAAVTIARTLGISELLISSTIIAMGTSLPELITSIVGALKKEMDISIGNVVGSNIFNIFLVLGVTSVISPLVVPAGIMVDLIILMLSTLLLFAYMFVGKKHTLHRWEGISFLMLYITYTIFIIYRG
jgi:cation:H+ antiporter